MAGRTTKRGISNFFLGTLYILAFVSIASLVYTILHKKRENFQMSSNTSSRTLYRMSNNFDNDVNSLSTVLSDNDDPLIMAGCYQFKPDKNPMDYLPQDCYVGSFGMYTNNFDEIRENILSTLKTLSVEIIKSKIAGDIYVLISQSPYMRDSNGNVITVQYNISSYNFQPKVGPNLSEVPLLIRAFIILPLYDRNLVRKTAPSQLLTTLSSTRTNKDQCFVSCVNDNTDTYCGCLNTTKNTTHAKSYTSACSTTPDIAGTTNKSVNIPADFFVLYRLNPLSTIVAANNIFDR